MPPLYTCQSCSETLFIRHTTLEAGSAVYELALCERQWKDRNGAVKQQLINGGADLDFKRLRVAPCEPHIETTCLQCRAEEGGVPAVTQCFKLPWEENSHGMENRYSNIGRYRERKTIIS